MNKRHFFKILFALPALTYVSPKLIGLGEETYQIPCFEVIDSGFISEKNGSFTFWTSIKLTKKVSKKEYQEYLQSRDKYAHLFAVKNYDFEYLSKPIDV